MSAEVDASIPDAATFWVPRPRDIDDDGFGFFRDEWPIVAARTASAAAILAAERLAVRYADLNSSTPAEFEKLAILIENLDPESADVPAPMREPGDDWPGLAGLELGVAGLVYALSNCGFYPCASCRSHDSEHSWSPNPVVFFAGDYRRVALLQPIVRASGCGFTRDPARPEVLAIDAPSIRETMALAGELFASRASFRQLPKTSRRRRCGPPARQETAAPDPILLF